VINDILYIGGCNLSEVRRLDVMAKWQDPAAAAWVFAAVHDMVEQGSTQSAFGGKDRQLQLDANSTLFIDAGVPDQSTILQNAYRLIDEADDHIFLTCQYFPGGPTARRLKAARERGVEVAIRYSHPSAFGSEAPAHYLYGFREQVHMPAAFFSGRLAKGRPLLHAKVLCTEKGAVLGSHNYVAHGVAWGTAEIALRCDSPGFSDKLRAFMLKQIDI
jgi:hypothetical protein